ncbi:shikimate dehydrogenase [Aureimonas flava]|uniref:Shikimate dehydrogenase n=1 Tax=Aureimonas flava TaxID=2320271 RepID=A0A3A1WTZ7_9HYPH|nr:shikimate dehydrogenase [Aureimonas flava]RIY01401.1 shikimate dehydrogenase [Aureimonas flava]
MSAPRPDLPAAFTGRTRLSFLIGTPIAQVLAPGRMSALMASRGHDGILVPLEVRPDDLADTVSALRRSPSVDAILATLPHKRTLSAFCERLSDPSRMLGAVNATRRAADGVWEGDNFDGEGMSRAIETAGARIEGATIHMVGAGAAGTAIAVSLLARGARRLTFNDVQPEAELALASLLEPLFPGRSVAMPVEAAADAAIVVNASHCGLKASDPLPVPAACLAAGQTVADVITDPLETPLLRNASAKGCRTVDGGAMLAGQLDLLLAFIRGSPLTGAGDGPGAAA